jgi:hypothetical protein
MSDEDLEKRTDAEFVASIRERIEQLKGYRTSSFPAIEKKPGAKLVRMAAVWKSALAYRLVDIADAAVDLIESGRLVPGCILARSVLETVAGVHMLGKRISATREVEQFEGLIDFLMKASFGSRDDSSKFKALNVLTMLDHLDKKYEITQQQYEHLSEYTHPNLKGGLMAYSDIDLKDLRTQFGINPGGLPLGDFGLGDLELILEIAVDEYEAMEKDTEVFEKTVWRLAPEIFRD